MTLLTTLTAQVPSSATGLVPSYTSLGTNTGLTFPNTGREWIEVVTTGTTTTVTEKIGKTVQGQTPPGIAVVIAATTPAPVKLGPFPADFNLPGTSTVELDFSANTGVSVALFRMPGVS
jgi:hypothetical protein